MSFFTSVELIKNKLYIKTRETETGQSILHTSSGEDFDTSLYVKVGSNETSNCSITSLYSERLNKIVFKSIEELVAFKKESSETGLKLYGDFSLPNEYITQKKLYENPNFSQIHIGVIDIEVESEKGFGTPEKPFEEISVISLYSSKTKAITTFCKTQEEIEGSLCFKTEKELLLAFLEFWTSQDYDVVTSWNGEFYDFPYIFCRLKKVLSAKHAQSLSPFGIVTTSQVERMNTVQQTIQIVGMVQLDYLDLYKKFVQDPRDNYRLDTITSIELGEGKLDYSPYESLKEFYQKDFKRFVDYNKKDVDLLVQLDKKLNLLLLTFIFSYKARQNYRDIFSPIRTWDSFCFNYLKDNSKVVHPSRYTSKTESFEGAYVVDPKPGRYNWVATFDITSLYPSVIRFLGISPETIVTPQINSPLAGKRLVEELLEGSIERNPEANVSLSANGQFYRKDIKGMMPTLIETMFQERMDVVKRLSVLEKEFNETQNPDLKNQIATLNAEQMALKIALNSFYGALGSPFFRYFDIRNAEAVTLTGQVIIRSIQNKLDSYLKNVLKGTDGFCGVVGGDTDSCFLSLEPLINKFPELTSNKEKIELLDCFCSDNLSPIIEKVIASVEDRLNGTPGMLKMVREYLGISMIITGKKRYALLYADKKGIYFDNPKQKITGIESVRSSTPPKCRELIKDTIKYLFVKDNSFIIDFIASCKKQICSAKPDEIAFPRSANGLEKYGSSDKLGYIKGTPIQTRAALMFNKLVKKRGLESKYTLIQDGEKIKFIYLKLPNPFNENVMGWSSSELPKELNIEPFVDFEKCFEVGYLSAIETLLTSMGWKLEHEQDANSWF